MGTGAKHGGTAAGDGCALTLASLIPAGIGLMLFLLRRFRR